jgi:phosphoglycolate phosphatase-like HAD superfamily hydrolase
MTTMMLNDDTWVMAGAPATRPGALGIAEAVAPDAAGGPIVGVDCDGVLASDRLLWQVLRKRYPEAIPARYEDLAGYDWPRATDATTQLCLRLSADPAFAGRLEPMPHMAEALRALSEAGYRVHVITARPACVRKATRRWLMRHRVDEYVEEIHCVDHPLDKVGLARRLDCPAFVEDNHATAEALGAAGVRSYLLDAPYNRLPTRSSVRVTDWRELLEDLTRVAPPRRPAAAAPPLVTLAS